MKFSNRIIAILLYFIALTNFMYWIYFWNVNEKLAMSNHQVFIEKYVLSIPSFIRPLFPTYITYISLLFFIAAGILFLKEKKPLFIILSITAMLLAMLNLFSLM